MLDDLAALNKLSQMSPAGKMKDSKEVLKGKEIPPRKRGKRKFPKDSQEGEASGEKEKEKQTPIPSAGRVVDIII
jgi:hypothetical protein